MLSPLPVPVEVFEPEAAKLRVPADNEQDHEDGQAVKMLVVYAMFERATEILFVAVTSCCAGWLLKLLVKFRSCCHPLWLIVIASPDTCLFVVFVPDAGTFMVPVKVPENPPGSAGKSEAVNEIPV
jgi:hypothetical protein